jgi:hypothetical protein
VHMGCERHRRLDHLRARITKPTARNGDTEVMRVSW